MLGKMSDSMWLLARIAGVIVLVLLAAWAGLWAGEKSASKPKLFDESGAPSAAGNVRRIPEPPIFFFANVPPEGDWNIALAEVRMAAAAGVHQYVVPVGLPWNESDPVLETALGRLKAVCKEDAEARMLLYVRLDPPEAWRASHPDETARISDKTLPYASVGSKVWVEEAQRGLTMLWDAVKRSDVNASVRGCVVAALDGGRWRQAEGYDVSPANSACFRTWLRSRYAADAALQAAWGDNAVTVDTAAIPAEPDREDTRQVFYAAAELQRQADFVQYLSDQTADVIASLAAHIKTATEGAAEVIACYGDTFETSRSAAGQNGLSRIFHSDVDGLASPVSYVDRGLGGAGGPMGPIDAAALYDKRWYLIDDTRTGIVHAGTSGETGRMEGLRQDDVYSVQQRNFAAALTHGLGLFWTDPEGQGSLEDAEMWEHFGKMYAVYKDYAAARSATRGETLAEVMWPPANTFLVVVADEAGRAYQQCDAKLNEQLLVRVRDSILRAGVPAYFCLLQDVLDERAPRAAAYVFLNTFRLEDAARNRLHELMAGYNATAIWMYAPGYISDVASADNIAATVRMQVKAFDKPVTAGSAYQLAGVWMGKDETFGEAIEWAPLFYVDDEQVDILAKYKSVERASAAIAFFEEGWTSIFIGEPALTPALLRELLRMTDIHLYFPETPAKFYDAAYFGPYLLAVHGKETGERVVDFGADQVWNVQDLLVPDIGWLKKSAMLLPLKTGDTRLLKLTQDVPFPSE